MENKMHLASNSMQETNFINFWVAHKVRSLFMSATCKKYVETKKHHEKVNIWSWIKKASLKV